MKMIVDLITEQNLGTNSKYVKQFSNQLMMIN